MITNTEIAIRLVLSLVLGGLIGLERESHGRPAGFRTHILVSVGSTLAMLISAYAFGDVLNPGRNGDPGRIAAQVVSGIGFLGAGTILREGATIRGLTTAASLWTVAIIGLGVGAGAYFPAFIATLLVAMTLIFLNKIEWSYLNSKQEMITIHSDDTPGQLARVFAVLAKHEVNVFHVELSSDDTGDATLELAVEIPAKLSRIKLLDELISTPGINRASFR